MGTLRIPLRTGPSGQRRLTGHQIPPKVEFTGKHIAYPTWSLPLPPNEDIRTIFARPTDTIASFGKVLGNRTTLYKYLNPNLVGLVTGPAVGTPVSDKTSCAVYLVDGAKGTIIYHSVLPSVGGACDVKATLVENWLVYHYYDPEVGVNQAKNYRVVSVELYEGYGVDDKRMRYVLRQISTPTPAHLKCSSDMTSLSNETTAVNVYEQAYIFPRGIRTFAPTSTTYGITIKDIIGNAASTGSCISISPLLIYPFSRERKQPDSSLPSPFHRSQET